MSTATGMSLSELVAEAEHLKSEYQSRMALIRDIADANAGEINGSASTRSHISPLKSTSTSSGKKRGRPVGSKNAPKSDSPKSEMTDAPKKRGRPAKPKSGEKVAPDQRNYSNDISLRQAIWQILDQGPDQWAKSLPDFPEDAEGLTLSEVREMIDITGIWQSNSGDIGNQVSGHLTKLKKEGKIARGNNKRYYIVEGAELDAK